MPNTIKKIQKEQKNQVNHDVVVDEYKVLTKLNLPPSCSYNSAYKYLVLNGDRIDEIAHRIQISPSCIVHLNNLEDCKLSIAQDLSFPRQAFINLMLKKMCPVNEQSINDHKFLLALASATFINSRNKVRLQKLARSYAIDIQMENDQKLIT